MIHYFFISGEVSTGCFTLNDQAVGIRHFAKFQSTPALQHNFIFNNFSVCSSQQHIATENIFHIIILKIQ